jgi:hypothetical protein
MGSPNGLIDRGWRSTELKMGDQVTVEALAQKIVPTRPTPPPLFCRMAESCSEAFRALPEPPAKIAPSINLAMRIDRLWWFRLQSDLRRPYGPSLDSATGTQAARGHFSRHRSSQQRTNRGSAPNSGLRREVSKPLKSWSGRPGSNRRRPAWEERAPFNINNIAAQVFGSGASNTLVFSVAF